MLLAFWDGCCPRIDWYKNGDKQQGSFIIQAEKVNGNCYYLNEEGEWGPLGLWMCKDSWWYDGLYNKGQCKGLYHASTDSKPNVRVQDDSLQWQSYGYSADLKFKCVDLCLYFTFE